MAMNAIVAGTTIHVGDRVRLLYRVFETEKVVGRTKRAVKEKQRERLQPFEGVVISIRGREENQSFTVRRIGVHGIGVERIFPVMSPWISKIQIKARGKTRRAKLYYLRNRVGKQALKVKEKASKPSKKSVKQKKKSRPKSGLSRVKKAIPSAQSSHDQEKQRAKANH